MYGSFMEKRCKTKGRRYGENVDEIDMNTFRQQDDPDVFAVDDAEWGDVAPTAATPLQFGRHRHLSSFMEDGGSEAHSNAGFEDFQRQDSRMYSPFDTDRVFLFNSPIEHRVHIRKQLATDWLSSCLFRVRQCLQHVFCTFDCSCRDQRGVHCLHRLKKYAVRKLKVVQCIICLVSIIQSGMTFIPLGNITADFDGQCLLYSDIFIHWISRNGTVSLDLARTKFGSKNDCNFTTFINVVVAVVGLFFIWFFVRTSKLGGLEPTELKLQLPVFVCYFILLISVLVSSIKITSGFTRWCYNIIINNPLPEEKQRLKCKDYVTLNWTTDNRSLFYFYSVLAEVSSWLLTLTLFIQCTITAVHLYLDFKQAYEEIEVPHTKLDESSEDEQASWESQDILLTGDASSPPLPVYKVEYKKHQILAKVVIHGDTSPFPKFDPKGTFVLDKEKFKRHLSDIEGLRGLRSKGKVEFPLQIAPGRRRKLNWTGSCEELRSRNDLEDRIKIHEVVRSHEWHGFDTDITNLDGTVWTSQNLEWQADFGSSKVWPHESFDWPDASDMSGQPGKQFSSSSELHGFESDFVSLDKKTATALPADWQKFDTVLGTSKTGTFDMLDQDLNNDNQIEDTWAFYLPDLHTGEENHNDNEEQNKNEDENLGESDNTSRVKPTNVHLDPFERDKR